MLPTQGKSLLLATALAVAAVLFGTPGPAAADRTIDAREFVILSDDIYKQMQEVEHAEGVSGGIVDGGSGLPTPDGGDGSTGGDDGGSGGGDSGPSGGDGGSGGGDSGPSGGDGGSGGGDSSPSVGGGSDSGPSSNDKDKEPNTNHSGLGDGTNPGQGGGSENSPNQGVDNPNNKKK